MARKTKKARKNAQRTRVRSRIRGGVLALCVITAFVMIGFASVISSGMAVSVAGILLIASVAMFEKRRRSFWETSMHHKMRGVTDGHDELEREVSRNRNDIAKIKAGMADTAKDIKKSETPKVGTPSTPAMASIAERLEALAQNTRSSAREPLRPRAIKPAQTNKNRKPSKVKKANDEEAEYYKSLSDTVVTELMRHAIGSRDINVFVQPIMRLPQRKTRFFELFARIRVKPGLYVPASRYLKLAKKENLLNDIDELLLMHCLKSLKESSEKDDTLAYFMNVSSATLKNTDFMNRLLGFIAKNRELAPRLVFEIRQSDFDDMHPALLQVLRGLGTLGCSLSLDHIKHVKFDLALLQSMKVRFVKFNALSLIKKASDEKGAADIWRMKRKLEGNGIGFVVEKIEDERTLKELLDFDIHYGQGYLLGKPEMQGAYKKSNAAKHIREARRINNQGRA